MALGEAAIKLEKFLIRFWHPACLRSCLLRKWYHITNVPALSFLAIVLIIGSSPSCRPGLLEQEAVQTWKRKMGVVPETSQAASELRCCKSLSHSLCSYKHKWVQSQDLAGLAPSAYWDEYARDDAKGEVRVPLPKYSYSCGVHATDLLRNAPTASQ